MHRRSGKVRRYLQGSHADKVNMAVPQAGEEVGNMTTWDVGGKVSRGAYPGDFRALDDHSGVGNGRTTTRDQKGCYYAMTGI